MMRFKCKSHSRTIWHLLGRPFLEFNKKPSAAIVLAGKGRSGTTWMVDIINYRKDYRHIFEPFHPEQMPMCQHLGPRKYVRPDSKDPSFLRLVDSVLRGNVRSEWTDYTYSDNDRWLYSKRLIKTIRATLFLKWLTVNFRQVPVVLALRHPLAVANSIMKRGWKSPLPAMMRQKKLVQDFLMPFVDPINSIGGIFEEHIFSWCIEYYVVFKQFRIGEIHLLFYENLWEQPEKEIERLFDFLEENYDSRVMEAIRRPSSVTTKQSEQAIALGKEEVLTKWQKELTRTQIKRGIEILEIFGLDRVYADSPMPSETAALALMNDQT
jgi:hypothetical protein